jgi:hypothetical protein
MKKQSKSPTGKHPTFFYADQEVRAMLAEMVGEANTDRTKFLSKLIRDTYKRQKSPTTSKIQAGN